MTPTPFKKGPISGSLYDQWFDELKKINTTYNDETKQGMVYTNDGSAGPLGALLRNISGTYFVEFIEVDEHYGRGKSNKYRGSWPADKDDATHASWYHSYWARKHSFSHWFLFKFLNRKVLPVTDPAYGEYGNEGQGSRYTKISHRLLSFSNSKNKKFYIGTAIFTITNIRDIRASYMSTHRWTLKPENAAAREMIKKVESYQYLTKLLDVKKMKDVWQRTAIKDT